MKSTIPVISSRVCIALAATLVFGGICSAEAANRTWSGGISGANIGVWAANNNWGGVSYPAAGDTAIFTSVVGFSSAPKVTIDNLSIANLTFNSGAASFTIVKDTGVNRSLTVTNLITQNAANAQTISLPLAGAWGLTKAGAGVLLITNVNTYTGPTTINAGKLLGRSGGSVDSVVTVAAAAATNGVQVATAAGQWRCNGVTFNAAGTLAFDFNNGVAPDGTTAPLQVNGDVAFTATPAVVILNNSIPATTASYPLVSYTGSFSGLAPTAVTISPALSGGATASLSHDTLNKVLKLEVSAGGTPTKLAYTSLPATPQQGLAFSVTVQAQNASSVPANVTNATTVTLSVGSGSGSLSGTISGVIPNGQSSVTISGVIYSAADTMTLTATPTAGMTGLTPVTSDNLAFAPEPTKLAYTSVPSGVTVSTPFSVTVQAQDAGSAPRSVTSNTTITLSTASGSGTLGGTTNGTITAGNSSVTISGITYDNTDTMTLTASTTAGMSLTPVTSGNIVFLPGSQTLHWGTNDANWTDTDAWYNTGTSAPATYNDVAPDAVVFEDTHSGTGDRIVTLTNTVSPASVTATAASRNFTIVGPGAISGGTGLSKSGAGTLILSNANSFTGDTRIEAGALTLGAASALLNSTLDLNTLDSGNLSFGPLTAATVGGLKGGRDLALTNASGAAVALTVGNNNSNSTYLGILSGAGGFAKTGTGTFTWGDGTTTNTYDGDTLIGQGTVVVSSAYLLPSGPGKGNLTVNGTLLYGGDIGLTVNGLIGSGTITMGGTFAAPTLTVGENDADGNFSGVISRGSSTQNTLTKVGAGTLILGGANAIGIPSGSSPTAGVFVNGGKIIAANASGVGAYACTVNAGTLEITNLAVSTALRVNLNNGATLMGSGGTASAVGSSTRNITIDLGAAVTMRTDAASDTLTAVGLIAGGDAGSVVTAAGPGTIVLSTGSATSAYAGKWKLTGGTLQLGNANSLGNSISKAIELAGGTLEPRVAGDATFSTATVVSGNSTITPNQAGAGANHAFGTLSITNATLNLGPGAQVTASTTETNSFSTTTLTGDATLNVTNNGTKSMTVVLGAAGQSGGARALAKQGDGTLIINGASTYTGGSSVAGGTFEVGLAGSIDGNVSVANGAVFRTDSATALEATATLTLDASPSAGTVNLNFPGTQTIRSLYFGATEQAAGTWGALGSGATHQTNVFAGPGILSSGVPTTTTLSASANPAVYGSLVLTSTVAGSGGPPTGTVTFKEGANVIGTASLAAGVATLNPGSSLAAGGPYSLTASYSGDATFAVSSSSPLSQTLTKADLTVADIQAVDKVYDGTTNATLIVSNAVLVGVMNSDPLTLVTSNAAGAFASKHVGVNKLVQVSGLEVYGDLVTNYTLIQPTTNATISVKPITVTAVTDTKVYDGTTNSAGIPTISPGLATGDTANFSQSYDNKDAGTGKTLTPAGSVTDGNGGNNYSVSFASDTTGVITPLTTSCALISSVNPSGPGTNVTFTATVAGVPPAADQPSGDVVFLAGGVPFSTNALVSGQAAANNAALPLGTNVIQAEYAGALNFLASTGAVDQVVQLFVTCSQTNALLSISNNLDGTFTLTFLGTPQADYYIVASADVTAAMNTWAPLSGSTNTVTNGSGLWQFIVTNTAPQRFYRSTALAPCP